LQKAKKGLSKRKAFLFIFPPFEVLQKMQQLNLFSRIFDTNAFKSFCCELQLTK